MTEAASIATFTRGKPSKELQKFVDGFNAKAKKSGCPARASACVVKRPSGHENVHVSVRVGGDRPITHSLLDGSIATARAAVASLLGHAKLSVSFEY